MPNSAAPPFGVTIVNRATFDLLVTLTFDNTEIFSFSLINAGETIGLPAFDDRPYTVSAWRPGLDTATPNGQWLGASAFSLQGTIAQVVATTGQTVAFSDPGADEAGGITVTMHPA